jgi:hypothetical protein
VPNTNCLLFNATAAGSARDAARLKRGGRCDAGGWYVNLEACGTLGKFGDVTGWGAFPLKALGNGWVKFIPSTALTILGPVCGIATLLKLSVTDISLCLPKKLSGEGMESMYIGIKGREIYESAGKQNNTDKIQRNRINNRC